MRQSFLKLPAFIILLALTLSLSVQPAQASDLNELLRLVNQERTAAGVAPLSLDTCLSIAADNHAEDMALNNYFSHTGLDGSSPGDRARRAGYTGGGVGENIAAGQVTPRGVLNAWMASSGHRRNILNSGYRVIGLGYSNKSTQLARTRWVQVFGSSTNSCDRNNDEPDTATLTGRIAFQATSHPTNDIPLTLEFYQNNTLVSRHVPVLGNDGQFSISNVPAGNYQVWIKHQNHLARRSTITLPGATIDFGTLPSGDVNNDNRVTLADFSLLSGSFNKSSGHEGYVTGADFTGDSRVTLQDFSLLVNNFNQIGATKP